MTPENFVSIVTSQLADPFRIGLMAALIYTTIRNAPATGWLVPLAAGVAFVAFIISATMPNGGQTQLVVITTGIVSNIIIACILLGGILVWKRFSK